MQIKRKILGNIPTECINCTNLASYMSVYFTMSLTAVSELDHFFFHFVTEPQKEKFIRYTKEMIYKSSSVD